MSRKKQHKTRHEKSLWKEFQSEIFIAFLFLLGVFLIVEKLEIKQTVFHSLRAMIQWAAREISTTARFIATLLAEVETSDIVGIILIFAALFLMVGRLRRKVIRRYEHLYSCPRCGNDLRRIHRSPFQKVMQVLFFVRIKHYTCKKCDFRGVQVLDR